MIEGQYRAGLIMLLFQARRRYAWTLAVDPGKYFVPLEPFAAALGDHNIVTTSVLANNEGVQRLIELVRHGRLDLTPLLTQTFPQNQIR